MANTKKIADFTITLTVIAFALNFVTVTCSPPASEEPDTDVASPDSGFEIDSMCDCDDPDALYHRIVRQIINDQGMEGKEKFLQEFLPKRVCGSDGNRYENGCELQCARLKNTNSALHPVRGCRKRFQRHGWKNPKKNMKMHSERKSAALLKQEESPIERQHLDNPRVCICPRNYFPVCASNGVTYSNHCVFNCAKENQYPDMAILRNGKCDEDDETFLSQPTK